MQQDYLASCSIYLNNAAKCTPTSFVPHHKTNCSQWLLLFSLDAGRVRVHNSVRPLNCIPETYPMRTYSGRMDFCTSYHLIGVRHVRCYMMCCCAARHWWSSDLNKSSPEPDNLTTVNNKRWEFVIFFVWALWRQVDFIVLNLLRINFFS